MRLHRHRLGKANHWHSVRARHDSAWDWCAHHEEVEQHLEERRHTRERVVQVQRLELQPAR